MQRWRTPSFAFAVRTCAPLCLEIIIHVRIRSVQLFVLIKCLFVALHSLLTLSPVFNDWICWFGFFSVIFFSSCHIQHQLFGDLLDLVVTKYFTFSYNIPYGLCYQYGCHWNLQVKENSTEALGLDSIFFSFFETLDCDVAVLDTIGLFWATCDA